MVPQREIFWNISFSPVLYILATLVVIIRIYAFYRRYKMWHLGKADNRAKVSLSTRWKTFVSTAIIDGLFHRKFIGVADNLGHRGFSPRDFIPRELYAGAAHFLIFAGFFVLLIGTAMDVISHYGYDFLIGNVYLGHTIAMDLAGLALILGLILAAVRRYIMKPERLDNKTEDPVALVALFVIAITGFFIQAVRLAYYAPPWAWWSPAGYILSFALSGISKDALLVIHRSLWWFHAVFALGAMAYVALSWNRLWHIFVAPFNIYFRNLELRGAMVPIDMEKAESFGAAKIRLLLEEPPGPGCLHSLRPLCR